MFDLSEIKLNPCPFCGGEAILKSESCFIPTYYDPDGSNAEIVYWIRCVKCGAQTRIFKVEQNAVKTWNRRTQNVETKQTDKIHVNEVVYTKSSVCVLDIGLVESVNPLSIYARSNKLDVDGNYKRYYGNPSGSNWHGTGIYKTYDEWKDLTIDWTVEWEDSKGTEEICNILGIPYWMKGVMRNDTRRSD